MADLDSGVRVLSDRELWRLLVAEFGVPRLVRMFGWLRVWLWMPGRDLRSVINDSMARSSSYRVLADIQHMLEVWATAEGRVHDYTLWDLAVRMEQMHPSGIVVKARKVKAV